MRRAVVVLVVSTLTALTATVVAAPASAAPSSVAVSGAVAHPTSFTLAQLRAMPQTTLPDLRSRFGGSVTGVPVADLVQAAAPVLPPGKNTSLRLSVTVRGSLGVRTIALGELDPSFGNHPALLALSVHGYPLPGAPYLAVPGDRGYARTVVHVTRLDVAVASPRTPTTAPGSVVVSAGRHSTTLSAATLARLPQRSATVTFSAAGQPQTHTESGPSLAAVLQAAHVRVTSTTVVTAVGSDGYAASVTPAEATSGRRPLLISTVEDGVALTRPRLIAVGDVKGGRNVSDLVDLDVTSQASARTASPPAH